MNLWISVRRLPVALFDVLFRGPDYKSNGKKCLIYFTIFCSERVKLNELIKNTHNYLRFEQPDITGKRN